MINELDGHECVGLGVPHSMIYNLAEHVAVAMWCVVSKLSHCFAGHDYFST